MVIKRLTLFAGHYGSGKTNIALNWARYLKRTGRPVTIADLDIVNPYFRTKDDEEALKQEGIKLICSPYANSNVDFPAMPKEVYGLIDGREGYGVLDIGGDDRGALALGRYVPSILKENDYAFLAVINASRPMTRTPQETEEALRDIEYACGMRFTGLVNNTNLGPETTAETVLNSMEYAYRTSERMGIPLEMTTVREDIAKDIHSVDNLFPIRIKKLYYHLNGGMEWEN